MPFAWVETRTPANIQKRHALEACMLELFDMSLRKSAEDQKFKPQPWHLPGVRLRLTLSLAFFSALELSADTGSCKESTPVSGNH